MLWSPAENYDNVAVLKGHTNAVTSLAWTYTDRLLTASADKSVVNWDVEVIPSQFSSKNQSENIEIINALFMTSLLQRRHWISLQVWLMTDSSRYGSLDPNSK
jgi:WD40 repeat protein